MSQQAFRWNKLTTKEKKALTSDKVFKNIIIRSMENEIACF